jgi:hypothetical protein
MSSVIIKSLEKKPMKGGTPAMEKSKTVIKNVEKELKLNPLKVCSVLNWVEITLKIVQNSIVRERLYNNIYVNK